MKTTINALINRNEELVTLIDSQIAIYGKLDSLLELKKDAHTQISNLKVELAKLDPASYEVEYEEYDEEELQVSITITNFNDSLVEVLKNKLTAKNISWYDGEAYEDNQFEIVTDLKTQTVKEFTKTINTIVGAMKRMK